MRHYAFRHQSRSLHTACKCALSLSVMGPKSCDPAPPYCTKAANRTKAAQPNQQSLRLHKLDSTCTQPVTFRIESQAAILVQELPVEHTQLLHHALNVLLRRQEGRPEVQRVLFLPKAAAWYNHNARRIQ